jgi:hypothetical protein
MTGAAMSVKTSLAGCGMIATVRLNVNEVCRQQGLL